MTELDKTIHQPTRLRIMAALTALKDGEQIAFRQLAKTFELTDGNLGAHLQTLEAAGYISIEKSFVHRKPCTHIAATHMGKARFESHVKALKQILGDMEP
jgi:DNA-binding MarR family transcriptional regulator